MDHPDMKPESCPSFGRRKIVYSFLFFPHQHLLLENKKKKRSKSRAMVNKNSTTKHVVHEQDGQVTGKSHRTVSCRWGRRTAKGSTRCQGKIRFEVTIRLCQVSEGLVDCVRFRVGLKHHPSCCTSVGLVKNGQKFWG